MKLVYLDVSFTVSKSSRRCGDWDGDDDGDKYLASQFHWNGDANHYQSSGYPCIKDKKVLFIFLGGSRLSYYSIPINSLFFTKEYQKALEVRHPQEYSAASGTSCIRWKDFVYLIGGKDRDRMTIVQDSSRLSRNVMRLRISRSSLLWGDPRSLGRSPMHSGKDLPIVLEHQDILYVIAHMFLDKDRPTHCFESYNPETDKWDILEPPPFYDEDSKYYDRSPIPLSYVVIDNKICILSDDAAFAYDVICKKWEPCYLFNGFKGFDVSPRQQKDIDISFMDNVSDDIGISGEMECGQAFDFAREGIVHGNKYLISTLPHKALVVAYEICSGKVVRKQKLFDLPELLADDAIFRSLVALSGDKFCLMYTKLLGGRIGARKLVLVTFTVSISKVGSKEYLVSGVWNKCKIDLIGDDGRFSMTPFAV